MDELVTTRKRIHKFKIGTHVSVLKTYFTLESNSTEPRFYGEVVKVLDNGHVRVRWDIDQTHSVVMQDDLKLDINLPRRRNRTPDNSWFLCCTKVLRC